MSTALERLVELAREMERADAEWDQLYQTGPFIGSPSSPQEAAQKWEAEHSRDEASTRGYKARMEIVKLVRTGAFDEPHATRRLDGKPPNPHVAHAALQTAIEDGAEGCETMRKERTDGVVPLAEVPERFGNDGGGTREEIRP